MSAREREPWTVEALLEAVLIELRAIRSAIETNAGQDALMRPRELAALLRVSARQLQRMRELGQLPKNVGTAKRPKWRRSDVDSHLARLKAVR